MEKLMKVYLSREDGRFIELDLPADPAYIQDEISLLTSGIANNSVYISDYEYLIPNLSYEDGEKMNLVNQFTNVFELNEELSNITKSYNPDAAIALLIADIMHKEDLKDIDDIENYICSFEPIKLDENIFNYNPKYEEEYYWYILEVTYSSLSDRIASNNAEPYFDVIRFVKDMVLGDATVTSTGYLVWHFA